MTVEKQKLEDVLLSSMIVTDVTNLYDEDGIEVHIRDNVVKNSSFLVKSSGIYDALVILSAYTLNKALEFDLKLESELTPNGEGPVSSKKIWNFVYSLSNDIKTYLENYEIDLLNSVQENETHGV